MRTLHHGAESGFDAYSLMLVAGVVLGVAGLSYLAFRLLRQRM